MTFGSVIRGLRLFPAGRRQRHASGMLHPDFGFDTLPFNRGRTAHRKGLLAFAIVRDERTYFAAFVVTVLTVVVFLTDGVAEG